MTNDDRHDQRPAIAVSTNHYDPRQTFIYRPATCLQKLITRTLPRTVDWTVCLTWARNSKKLDPGFFYFWYPCTKTLLPQFWLVPLHHPNFKTLDLGSNLVPLHQTKLPETLNVVLILVPLHQNKTSGNFEFGFNWFGALAPTQTSRNPSWFELIWCPCTKPKPFETFYWLRLTWCPCTNPRLLEQENWLN